MKSGLPRTIIVSFEAGTPDGDISYLLSTGTTGMLTPGAGAVSVTIPVPPLENTLPAGELFGYREASWSYTTGGVTVTGSERWTLEGNIPFGATCDGARAKLGLDIAADLPDDQIPLVRSYFKFQAEVGEATLAALETGTAYQRMLICDAIEATAALALLPTMQVRLAKSETSGTNTYVRQDIDWKLLANQLEGFIAEALAASAPNIARVFDSMFTVTDTTSLFPDG